MSANQLVRMKDGADGLFKTWVDTSDIQNFRDRGFVFADKELEKRWQAEHGTKDDDPARR